MGGGGGTTKFILFSYDLLDPFDPCGDCGGKEHLMYGFACLPTENTHGETNRGSGAGRLKLLGRFYFSRWFFYYLLDGRCAVDGQSVAPLLQLQGGITF